MRNRLSGEEIREIRKKSGLTLAEFAHEIGSTQGTVWNWENNKSKPGKMSSIVILKMFED